ncbi:TrkA family potassium uptake protein [Halovenus sp. WSH3]|uniref:TrkA family potassium uptake protein n=1 Tax=Halovenus carboxidivorans TaxID=2692199 RepID=A0A6B0T1R0_9EURY|nr:NAD-binding protein [Halovenus carboxidivorans]MXR51097.1 TrkA family potassium uptake protein [Halovenus carboxidivorans]
MDSWKRRALGYLGFVGVALLLTTLGYQYGMRTYEGEPKTFIDSFQFAVEMFTTTGFGGDAPWNSPEMQLYIAVTDLLGMALLVGTLPVFVGPVLEEALSTSAPTTLDEDLDDHVVICSSTSRAHELIDELDSQDVPYVIVEPDRERADELSEDGHRVVRADPESAAGLRTARLPEARALFADVSDQVDASIVLAAKEVAAEVPVVSVVEEPDRAKYHRLAGADHVLSPRRLLGRSLAQKVTTALRSEVDEAVEIDGDLELVEVSIHHGSDLAGLTLADSGIREQSGVNVVGAWMRGEFIPSPTPETTLPAGTVLLVSGRPDQLTDLVEMTQSSVREFRTGKTVVVGYGAVGQTVAETLSDADIEHTVIDVEEGASVDVVGDATETDTLDAAGIEEAQTAVLALPNDTMTEFATLVIRDTAPETEIITRVNDDANVSKTYRAGADYVLSLATVTGRLSSSYLLEDHDRISVDQQVEIRRLEAPGIVGTTLGAANVRERTGCTVIALERGEQTRTELGPETEISRGDELIVVGTSEALREFERQFT